MLNHQLRMMAPRTMAASHGEARRCSRMRSFADLISPESIYPVGMMDLVWSCDAPTTARVSDELVGALRQKSWPRL